MKSATIPLHFMSSSFYFLLTFQKIMTCRDPPEAPPHLPPRWPDGRTARCMHALHGPSGVWQLNIRKITAGLIKPVFFCQIFRNYTCAFIRFVVWYIWCHKEVSHLYISITGSVNNKDVYIKRSYRYWFWKTYPYSGGN